MTSYREPANVQTFALLLAQEALFVPERKQENEENQQDMPVLEKRNMTNAVISIRMLRNRQLQPRSRRQHLPLQSRDPQGPIPQQLVEEEVREQSRRESPRSRRRAP